MFNFLVAIYHQICTENTVLQFHWCGKEIGSSLRIIHCIMKILRNEWDGLNNFKRTHFMNFTKPVLSIFSFFKFLKTQEKKDQLILNNSWICFQYTISKYIVFIGCRDAVQMFIRIQKSRIRMTKPQQIRNLGWYPGKTSTIFPME